MEHQSSSNTSEQTRQMKDRVMLEIRQNWGEDVTVFFEKSKDLPHHLQILPPSYISLHHLRKLSRHKDVAGSMAFINRAFVNRVLRELTAKAWRGFQHNKTTVADISDAVKLQNEGQSAQIEDSEIQRLKKEGIPLEPDVVTGVLAAPWIVSSQPRDLPAWPRLYSERQTRSAASEEVERARRVQESEFRASLGMRTSTEVLEALQRESEESNAAKRRRIRGPSAERCTGRGERLQTEEGYVVGGSDSAERVESQEEELAGVMVELEAEFAEKERLSHGGLWCQPIPHETKVSAAADFYTAFHDARTLPIRTCTVCYRKFAETKLEEVEWGQWMSNRMARIRPTQLDCRRCFPAGEKIPACAECIRDIGRGVLSPAARLHGWLGCEHTFPDELKGLSPVEEKLIALNSCYGFITKYSVVEGQKRNSQGAGYVKHIKGHLTVFPNNVQELISNVLPHPLLKVLDDIHVSWQGAEKPAPKDLSVLLSVRRSAVESALLWLKRNNPLYADIQIDTAEMESWDSPPHGVPSQVYERLERNEPSAYEKTRTAHVVPPTERGLEAGRQVDVREILETLNRGEDVAIEGAGDGGQEEEGEATVGAEQGDVEAAAIQEIGSSGMFNLDGIPDITDAEKLQYVYDALGQDASGEGDASKWKASAQVRQEDGLEPYILVSRGKDFAEYSDPSFFAKTFPTLFPFGKGGPRQAEETTDGDAETVTTMAGVVSSRNLSIEAWARLVLRRHGGRFATHRVFPFLVFNMLVRFRNRNVSMMSVKKKNFGEVEQIIRSLTAERLEKARTEMEASGKTGDKDVYQLLRFLSPYGFRQPMSREVRLSMRRKIKSGIIHYGIPAIWFTLNPNDITNPVKLRLAAYQVLDPEEAEAFLTELDTAYKKARLAISDPLSSVEFFHREISMFFEHYVKVGKDSVFGRVSHYFGAVETNERGALHLHGLIWLHGNMHMSSIINDAVDTDGLSYRQRIIEYVDSVFTEDLDQEAACALQRERNVTSDISSMLQNGQQFSAAFEEEANFCAGFTQIHTHSPTCVKYAINRPAGKRDLCRFKAPWRLVEKTSFTEDGVLQIRRSHSMVNRWNKAMAVGLRHNHDISFIATQCKTLAIVFYVTNYATKIEDPVWKRVAAAAAVFNVGNASGDGQEEGQGSGRADGAGGSSQQFLMKVANRVFTERTLSHVEVTAHLLGYPSEFSHNTGWAFLNVWGLYWEIFRRWHHLRNASGGEGLDSRDETVVLEQSRQKITLLQAYPHRGDVLRQLSLYDYMSVVRLKRKRSGRGGQSDVELDSSWVASKVWVQVLRKRGEHAVACLDSYLSMDFKEEDDQCHRRAAVQHLGIFVPWEQFLGNSSGDINDIWERQRTTLSPRLLFVVDNIQLLRRSAEDAKHDAKQWASLSGETDAAAEATEAILGEEDGGSGAPYLLDNVANATRLIDVLRSAIGRSQITAGSKQISMLVKQLYNFQQMALGSIDGLHSTMVLGQGSRMNRSFDGGFGGADIPEQDKVRSIRSQQVSASRERERMIQGIQDQRDGSTDRHSAALHDVLSGFGADDIWIGPSDPETVTRSAGPTTSVQLGPSTSFSEDGRQLAELLTLNRRQSIALWLLCRHLDRIHRDDRVIPQLCLFVGGEGGTGKSRVIEAVVQLFARRRIAHRLLVTATSGTAAAGINGITIHSACKLSKDVGSNRSLDRVTFGSSNLRIDSESRVVWEERQMLIIDEVSMLGARTLHAVNEQLCMLRGSKEDFGGIPVVLFCGDFHQFRPVQERSILLSSSQIPWDEGRTFRVEQRHQHDKAHSLWRKFSTVVMLKEQLRAAADPCLQQLLARIRQGLGDQGDVDLLNSMCYQEDRQIPWESGLTVVTPLNRNRWNLNIEAVLSFQKQHRRQLRIFISEHKWKDGRPTEEEAAMLLNVGDDSAITVPAIFMFVSGMPVVVNQNTHQGLKLVNGSNYSAVEVILDKAYPGHRISADTIIHFGPPAGILLAGETTKDFHFIGMPSGTVLLTPLSCKIEKQRKRPWQRSDATRRGLPCTAAFACTDYKVQGRTLDRVAVELRGTRTTNIGGQSVPSQCDPYSLYVQLSRCRRLEDMMLLSKARERDIIGNSVPDDMVAAENRLEQLSDATISEAESQNWEFWGRSSS